MTRTWFIVQRAASFAVVLGICGFIGCTTGRRGAEGPVPTSTNTLRYALTAEPTTLDPAMVEDGTTIDLLQSIYSGLVKWDENNKIVPDLAEKWDMSADGTVYTFHLRHGVKFHNGREVTAADFKYSLDRACDPDLASPVASSYLRDIVGALDRIKRKAGVTDVSGVKVIDPYTLAITIDSFKPYWLGDMTYPTGYVVCREAIEKNDGKISDAASAIGTGPFKLASFQRGYQVTLTANDTYYAGRPKLDGITRPIMKDATTRLNKYNADELDIVDVSPDDLDHINGDPKMKADLKVWPRASTWYVALNESTPGSPFAKPEVRQALSLAVDKQEVIHVVLHDQAAVANGIVPPGVPGYNPDIKTGGFNPKMAQQLLAKAGYPGGAGFPALTFSFRQDQPVPAKMSEVIQHQWKQNLGIDVQLRPEEWGQFLKERGRLPLFTLRWAADYLDPQDFLSIMLHTNKNGDHPENSLGYSNPQFDSLCDRADTEHNPEQRLKLYRQAEQIAMDDAAWISIFYQKDLELVKPHVHGIRDSLFGHLPHVTTTVTP